MKQLWLLRHAKSSWDDPSLPDHARGLSPRGRKAAARMARWMAANEVRPEIVLCSTALRARATLELIGDALGAPQILIERELYHADADMLAGRLRAIPEDAGAVMVIGHNPGLHDLTAALAPPGAERFPTGALAELRLECEHWHGLGEGGAGLERLVLPRLIAR